MWFPNNISWNTLLVENLSESMMWKGLSGHFRKGSQCLLYRKEERTEVCKAYDFLSTGNGNFIISNCGEVRVSSWLLLFHGRIFWSLFIPPIKTYVSEFEWSLLLKSRNKAFCKTCRGERNYFYLFQVF